MRVAEQKGMISKGEDAPVVAKKMAGRSLADFRATYDKSFIVPQRVKAALAMLAANGDEDCWRYESEFVKLAGVSIIDLGNVRSQFGEHVVVLEKRGDSSKRIWCGTKAVANKIKEMLS
jgi:hypothetical protein